MKHPEYDSPIEFVMSDITTQMSKQLNTQIDEMCYQATQRVGININKEKLLLALKYDSSRYRTAYKNGYETGYEKRDDEIIRCKDCKSYNKQMHYCRDSERACVPDWYCADGERSENSCGTN